MRIFLHFLFLVHVSTCLNVNHWIIETGKVYTPIARTVLRAEPESCMELCLKDPSCLGFSSAVKPGPGLDKYCYFADNGATLKYTHPGVQSFQKDQDVWEAAPSRTGLTVNPGSNLNGEFTARKRVNFLLGKEHPISKCSSYSPKVIMENTHSDSERAIKVIWSGATLASTWFAPDNAIGVGFTLDYGCIMRLNSIRIAQILYKTINNRATKKFDVDISVDNTNWTPWHIGGTFSNPAMGYQNLDEASWRVITGKQLRARYIRFTIKEFYGMGAGLSYFQANDMYFETTMKFS